MKIIYGEAKIQGKIQRHTVVSYQIETTNDLQTAFLTAEEKKIGNYQAGRRIGNQKRKKE